MSPLLVMLAALAVAAAGTPIARSLAWRLGLTADPSAVRLHAQPTPLMGGAAIFGAVILALAAAAWLGRESVAPQLSAILGGAALVALVGLLDDRKPMRPGLKLLFEALAALILIAAGVHVELLGGPMLPYLEVGLFDAVLSMLWVVGVTNAANLSDNMDGLLAGLCAVAAAAYLILALGSRQELVAPLAAALLGACLGFLIYNRKPASIFMGDAGSLPIGFLLAALGIKLRFPELSVDRTWLLPILVLAVPLFDTLLVVISRIRRGVNPLTTGGRDHLSHRLVARGATEREAVQALWLLATLAAGLAIIYRHVDGGYNAMAVGLLVGISMAAGLLRLEFEAAPEHRMLQGAAEPALEESA